MIDFKGSQFEREIIRNRTGGLESYRANGVG